ncbi:MAG: transporter substrate-binding domain-containing protein, partial [Anaerolineae bacterium]|nr:transporter substrate-binding domain-containing protein [Anaerolineae bacterium]
MRKNVWLVLALMLVVLVACSSATPVPTKSALPQAPAGTGLRKVQDRGKLVVGTRSDTPTFCYLNPQTNQLEGFDVALAKEIANYIFGDPSKVEFKIITSAQRIPQLKEGVIDLAIATMTINEERLKEIDFSVVYYVAGQRILVPQASTIKGLTDLDNKKVGAARGTTSATNLKQMTKAQVVEFDTWAAAAQALVAGQLDAVSTDDIILYGFQLAYPGTKVVGSQFSYEPYGVG